MSTDLEDKKAARELRNALRKEKKDAIYRALHSQPLRKIDTQGLKYLRESLGLPSNTQDEVPLDAIFIAIDFEHSHHVARTGSIRLREVGISSLDTRHIGVKTPDKIIYSKHYRTVTDTRQFLFGKSIDIAQDDLVILLKNLLIPHPRKPPRQLILVGHGFSFEIQVLRGLGINLALAPMVVNIVDTHYLRIEVFGQDFRLNRLTRQLGLKATHFHNAGNDAIFSLRAMLLLATHNLSEVDSSQQSKLEMYETIARS